MRRQLDANAPTVGVGVNGVPQRRSLCQAEEVQVTVAVDDFTDSAFRVDILKPGLCIFRGPQHVDPPVPRSGVDLRIFKVGVPLLEPTGRVVEEAGESTFVAEYLPNGCGEFGGLYLRMVVRHTTQMNDPIFVVAKRPTPIERNLYRGLLKAGVTKRLHLSRDLAFVPKHFRQRWDLRQFSRFQNPPNFVELGDFAVVNSVDYVSAATHIETLRSGDCIYSAV